ncbi:transglutaminase-like domain-containing protein [Methanopyrus kandleri]|nr:transglutaminase family protein [Methanopyrus kandleri]HII70551.1 transglutaminase family protein [Methanopyrus kandleri]
MLNAEPKWFQWVEGCDWAKYLATRDTPIVDWTGELIGENWRANWVRAAKYILYCAPYKGDSVEKVRQAWYGSITLEGHVPDKGAPAKFGEVDWSDKRPDMRYIGLAFDYFDPVFDFLHVPEDLRRTMRRLAELMVGLGKVSEREYAESILKDEYMPPRSGEPSRSREYEIRNGQYWLPGEWCWITLNGTSLYGKVAKSPAQPFPNAGEAERKLMNNNPMFQAAVRLAYWVATHIPFIGWFNWFPLAGYCGHLSPMYYEGPAAPLLFPDEGWVCTDHAVLTVALYRAAGIPGYVGGELEPFGDHSWTAVRRR